MCQGPVPSMGVQNMRKWKPFGWSRMPCREWKSLLHLICVRCSGCAEKRHPSISLWDKCQWTPYDRWGGDLSFACSEKTARACVICMGVHVGAPGTRKHRESPNCLPLLWRSIRWADRCLSIRISWRSCPCNGRSLPCHCSKWRDEQ